jgi:hypothetical protein
VINAEYRAAGERAGERDMLQRREQDAARAWFEHVAAHGEYVDSPGGRHLFEAAYERSYAQECAA